MRRGTSDTWKFHALLPRVAGKTLAEGHLLFLLVVCTCSVLSQDYDGFGGLNNWSNYTDRRVRWRWIKQIILHLSCCNLYLKIHYLSWAREPQGCLCHHPRRHHHEGRWGLLTEIFWQDNLQLLTHWQLAWQQRKIFTIKSKIFQTNNNESLGEDEIGRRTTISWLLHKKPAKLSVLAMTASLSSFMYRVFNWYKYIHLFSCTPLFPV